jgi:hypothetical protein
MYSRHKSVMLAVVPVWAIGLMFAVAPSQASAQWQCGDCIGWFEVIHEFYLVNPFSDRQCDNVCGCHVDVPCSNGCEVHADCPNSDEQDALTAAIDSKDVVMIRSALAAFKRWEYDSTKRMINVSDCSGVLLAARFPVPAALAPVLQTELSIPSQIAPEATD